MRRSLTAAIASFVVCVTVAALVAAPALALSPAVETLPAAPVGETTATLNGKVNPNGLETKYFFEYGTTTSYGSKTAEVSAGSGSSPLEKAQSISGLKVNTTYHYRIVASNSSGTSQGGDLTLKTVGAPVVLGGSADTKFLGEEATLTGTVVPNGLPSTFQFEYGTKSGTYTVKVPIPAGAVSGTGYIPVTVSATIAGLTPATKYFFRLTASNASGERTGTEHSFLSSDPPGIEVLPVSGLTPWEAIASVAIQPHGLATTSYLEMGTTTTYGSYYPLKEVTGTEVANLTQAFSGLETETLYHYRLVAENSKGRATSEDHTFRTLGTTVLRTKKEQLKVGTSLQAIAQNLSFEGEAGGRTCDEAELIGEVTENPGASQLVGNLSIEDEGSSGCYWKTEGGSTFSVRYPAPATKMVIDYWLDGSGEGVAVVPKFKLIQNVYAGVYLAKCEYDLELTGSFETGVPLSIVLSGQTKKTEGSIVWCPGNENVAGTFQVVAGEAEETVEALP